MRKFYNPLPVFFMLILACAAAHAQPAPQQTEDCRRAAARYIHPSPDKKHLTVEQEDEYEYRGMKTYLAMCGDSDDEFTRRIKQAVAGYEAAAAALAQTAPAPKPPPAPCDDSVRKELYGRFSENYKGDAEQKLAAYKAAKEYVCRCAEYDQTTLYLSAWTHNYASPHYFYPNGMAAAEAFAREESQRPRCRCDEMREELVSSLKVQNGRDRSQQNHETVKKFLNICGDTRRPIDRYLNDWVTKYDRAVREFEEQKRQRGEATPKGPTKEQ